MSKAYKTALCGVVSALCLVLMLLTGAIPIGTYALPALAGAVIIIIVAEINCKWAFAVYFVVSVLSFILAGDKEAALYFTAFFGFYPIVKAKTESMQKKTLEWVIKMLVFNASVTAAFFIALYVLGVPEDSFEINGIYLPWLFLILGNIIFVIYDIGLTQLITKYIRFGHPLLSKIFKSH